MGILISFLRAVMGFEALGVVRIGRVSPGYLSVADEEAVFLIGGVVVVAAVVIFLMFLEWSRRFTKWLAVILGIFLSLAGLCYVMRPWSYLVFLFVLLFIGLAISYGVT
ncbi:MAG: hypothetical protein ACYSUC_09605, partial [Planctomycetota bacterium]